MAKVSILDVMMSKNMEPGEFEFDSLWIPPMNYYLSNQDIEQLRQIATSARLSSQIQKKYDIINKIMVARGFKRFSAGTNRVVYRHTEDTRFLAKIAVDKVGMQDNPLEFQNQFLLKPFVTKMFCISPCGTVGFAERVLPVKRKEEFREIASDVFDVIMNKIIGLYVVEDIGTKFFMNWGIRAGFGPVLLDYPYVYKLDGNKLWCSKEMPDGSICNGEIDYDAGFNYLVCNRCGKRYLATNLRDNNTDNKIIINKGGFQMRVILKKGDQIYSEPTPVDEVMRKPARTQEKKVSNGISVRIHNPNKNAENSITEVKTKPSYVPVDNTINNSHKISISFNKNRSDEKKEEPREDVKVQIHNTEEQNIEPASEVVAESDVQQIEEPKAEYKNVKIVPPTQQFAENSVDMIERMDPRPAGTQDDMFRSVDDTNNDEENESHSQENKPNVEINLKSLYDEPYDDGRPGSKKKKKRDKGSKPNFIPAADSVQQTIPEFVNSEQDNSTSDTEEENN